MKFQNPSIRHSKVSDFTEKLNSQSKFQNSVICQNLIQKFSTINQSGDVLLSTISIPNMKQKALA